MKDRSITIDISLPEFQVLKYRKTETVYQIWLESRDDLGICPTCGHPTSSYHDSYERIIQDLPIMGIPVFYTSSRKDITVLTAEKISMKPLRVYMFIKDRPGVYRSILLALLEKVL